MKLKFLLVLSLFSINLHAWEIDLGVAKDYNIFVQNDFTHTAWSDSQGKIAVGGDANIGNLDVAVNYNPNQSLHGVQFVEAGAGYDDVLVVAGDVSVSRVDNIKGNLVLGGDLIKSGSVVNDPNALVQGQDPVLGEVFNFSDKPIDFDGAFEHLNQLSEDLAALSNTGEIIAKGNADWTSETEFIFTPDNELVNDAGVLVVSISGENLKKATDFYSTNLDPSTPIVVNVSGTDVHLDWVTYYDDLAQNYSGEFAYVGGQKNMPSNIIYNFYEAEEVTIDHSGFYGHILAPKADFEILGGDLSGQVIAKSWQSSGGQFNLWNGLYPSGESPETPAVSEPAMLVLFAFALFLALRKRREKSQIQSPIVSYA
ncbi:choice-of-anchor A family protein [Catenovulum maritimum]|uniref:Choice-of-anchor A domain-containing protein n=1 Tax=Catenovulum maritimum TaxID=1513271 RepID=A0A0J8GTF2_9ALTE|nr:choice-of-anchor A family protein [Catenovulum maritimum]KMT66012.1 hypothetical protein XM47_06050 [Catenovulum maritimum]